MADAAKKNRAPGFIRKVLDFDENVTEKFVKHALQIPVVRTLRNHGTALDYSCNGIAWFPLWIAFIWILNKKDWYEMQMNLLVGLILDVVAIAVTKAFFRRRRPLPPGANSLTIGPDKFSFPSGHASRAFLIVIFFTVLSPLPLIFWPPLIFWASCVAISRVLLKKHYLLDVLCGGVLSLLTSSFLALIWMSQETAFNCVNFLTSDNLPDVTGEDM